MDLEYTKPPLTYTQQVELLQSRGLVINSQADAERFLKQVNYYRFSAYCIPFQKPRDVFIPGTTFEKITELYRLDEALRTGLVALLSPVEIFLRTRIVYELSHEWGAFSHYESDNFRGDFNHAEWIASVEEEVNRGKEEYLEHYRKTYRGFPRLPLWIACEVMSLGSLSLLYKGLLPDLQREICSGLDIQQFVLVSWLHHITYIRNICAHHNRLWNRELSIRPFIPRKDERWKALRLDPSRVFTTIAILEWICRKVELPLCDIEPVFEVMNKISTLDSRFSTWMGGPAGRKAGWCWEVER